MNKKILLLLTICLVTPMLATAASFTESELLGLLLSNNPQLQQARNEQELSILDRKDAKTGYGPTIDLEISGTYLQNTMVLNIPSGLGLPSPLKIASEPTLYNFSLTLTQPIVTWGKLRNGVAMTEKLVEIRQVQRFALQKSLLAELRSRFYAQHYLFRMGVLLDEQAKHSQSLVNLVGEAFANSMVLEEEVLSAKVFAKQLELAKVQVDQQVQRQRSAIGRLCAIDLDASDDLVWDPDEQSLRSILTYDLKTLKAMATARNQEQVRIATLMTELASLGSSIAKGQLYWKPDMAMQVALGYGGSTFPFIEDGWEHKDDYSFNVSVGMKTTIWDGGKKFHEVSRNAIKESQAYLDMAQVHQAIEAQVEEAYLSLHLADENLAYLKLKKGSSEAEVVHQQFLFESGYGSEADLLKAKLASLSVGIEIEQQWLAYTGFFVTINALCGVENPLL